MTLNYPFSDYTWILIMGAMFAFAFGFATGANDLANAFGTSVGAKTLKLWHVVIIAGIFEFIGAMVLGRVSTSVIKDGVIDITAFYREPEMVMYGMMIALLVAAVWNILCCVVEMNVSSTHSIIGSLVGFALVYKGNKGVVWYNNICRLSLYKITDPTRLNCGVVTTSPRPFPYKGVAPIVLSWFFTPVLTGIGAAIIFFVIRTLVLRRKRAYLLSLISLPFFVALTLWVCIYFVFTKGAKALLSKEVQDWNEQKAMWISAIVSAGGALLTVLIAIPAINYGMKKNFLVKEDGTNELKVVAAKAETVYTNPWMARLAVIGKTATYGMRVDVHEAVNHDAFLHAMYERAEVFPADAEYAYSWLQVFSACTVSFAHGANDVGLFAGPISAIWEIYQSGFIKKSYEPALWTLGISAAGLVIGLATYGFNIIRAMGVRLAKLTPSRGFAAELATAMTILVFSQYGLPNSTSQCITGGILGIGFMEGRKAGKLGVNVMFMLKTLGSWVITMFVCGLFTAAIFSQGVYAPGVRSGKMVIKYEDFFANTTVDGFNTIYDQINKVICPEGVKGLPCKNVDAAGANLKITPSQLKALNTSIFNTRKAAIAYMASPTTSQDLFPANVTSYYIKLRSLQQYYSVNTLGQKSVFTGSLNCNNATGSPVACASTPLLYKGIYSKFAGTP